MEQINARIKEINAHLKNIVTYSVNFLKGIIARIKADEELGKGARKTKVEGFDKIDVKEVAKKDVELKYDKNTGYLGTNVAGAKIDEVSPFDRILAIRKNGMYSVTDLPEKTFVGADAWWIGVADKETLSKTVFTIIYKEKETGFAFIKRCVIEGWIMNKDYFLVPDGATVLHIDTKPKFAFTLKYTPKPRLKVLAEDFKAQDYNVRGLKAGGIRLSNKEVSKISTGGKKNDE
jgi:topoisomerase-4 subunit A